jgi:hypothetical protein
LVEIGSVVSEEKIFFNFISLFSIFSLAAILVGSLDHRTQFWKGAIQESFHKSLVQLAQWFLRRRFLCEFPIGSNFKLSSVVGAILIERPNRRTLFGREPSNDYFIKILFLLGKWFQTRRFLWEFPIGFYVKLNSAVVAILVGALKCRTQFWKRTTQESFQQSLVEISSVVSEKIFF